LQRKSGFKSYQPGAQATGALARRLRSGLVSK
jgi:hypothetical protein